MKKLLICLGFLSATSCMAMEVVMDEAPQISISEEIIVLLKQAKSLINPQNFEQLQSYLLAFEKARLQNVMAQTELQESLQLLSGDVEAEKKECHRYQEAIEKATKRQSQYNNGKLPIVASLAELADARAGLIAGSRQLEQRKEQLLQIMQAQRTTYEQEVAKVNQIKEHLRSIIAQQHDGVK